MRAWTEASQRLSDAVRWLVRSESARLLLVVTNPAWRMSALEVIALAEHEEDGLRPFVWLETEWTTSPKWDDRTAELADEAEALRTALREADLELLPPRSKPMARASGADAFARALYQLAVAIPEPLDGLAVVLAPLARADDPDFVAALRVFVADEGMRRARWIVVDERDDPQVAVLVRELGERALQLVAMPDPARLNEDVDETLAAVAEGRGAAGPGCPVPRIAIWDEPEEPVDPEPALLHGESKATSLDPTLHERLQGLVARSVLAMRERRSLDAIRLQREARDLMFLHGSPADGIRMELLLASVMVGAGFRREARDVLTQSAERAREADLPLLESQVALAQGGILLSMKEDAPAAAAFATAGRAAEEARERGMALEAYRLSGEAATRAGLPENAVEAWRRAVIVCGDDPGQSETDSQDASAMAARLAESCAKQGLTTQAESLNAQAQILAGFAARSAVAPQSPVPVADEVPAETPGPSTPAFREVRPEDLPRNKVPAELRGTIRIDDQPLAAANARHAGGS